MKDSGLSYNEINEVLMIGGSIRMPAVQEMVEKVTGHKLNLSVNPDEAVSIGAAHSAAIIIILSMTAKNRFAIISLSLQMVYQTMVYIQIYFNIYYLQ